MLDLQDMVTMPFLVQVLALLFFWLFLTAAKKFVRSATKKQVWKNGLLGALWALLFCCCALLAYDNYKWGKEFIFKYAMTSESVAAFSVAALRQCVGSGVNVNIQNEKGITPLMYAVYCNSVPNVRYLLSRGADPDLKDSYGESARDRAYKSNNPEMMALLNSFPTTK